MPGRLSTGTLSADGGETEQGWRIGRRAGRVERSMVDWEAAVDLVEKRSRSEI